MCTSFSRVCVLYGIDESLFQIIMDVSSWDLIVALWDFPM